MGMMYFEDLNVGDSWILTERPEGRGIFKNLIELINDRESVVLSIESTAMMATRPHTA